MRLVSEMKHGQLPAGPETSPSYSSSNTASAAEWSSEQLFGAAREVSIRHEEHVYRLRRTKQGKLILTK